MTTRCTKKDRNVFLFLLHQEEEEEEDDEDEDEDDDVEEEVEEGEEQAERVLGTGHFVYLFKQLLGSYKFGFIVHYSEYRYL